MDILKYVIFAIVPSFLGYISIIFIDYNCKLSKKRTINIKSMSFLIIRSKKINYQSDDTSVSLFALISQIIHCLIILLYFILGYTKYSTSGIVFCIDLARLICVYGILLLIIIILMYIKTIVNESK